MHVTTKVNKIRNLQTQTLSCNYKVIHFALKLSVFDPKSGSNKDQILFFSILCDICYS